MKLLLFGEIPLRSSLNNLCLLLPKYRSNGSILNSIQKYQLARWTWIAESDPPEANVFWSIHSVDNTFSCSAWIFCSGKLQRLSQILRVRSWDPEQKLKGIWGLNLTELAHFVCALNVLTGLAGVLLSHNLICPS